MSIRVRCRLKMVLACEGEFGRRLVELRLSLKAWYTMHAEELACARHNLSGRSRARPCPHRIFRTRHAGAAAGLVCVGRCLGSDCVLLLIVVVFC
jgi:hypothetical protein